MVYRLVEPEPRPVIDLSRHVATPAGVKRYHKPIHALISSSPSSATSKGSHLLRFEANSRKIDIEHATEVGKRAYGLDPRDQRALYEAHGFKMEFPDISDEDLYSEWDKATGVRQDRLLSEIHGRTHAMMATLALVQHAEKLAKREHLRTKTSDHWDEVLGKSKVGRVLLGIRNRMISDKALDRIGATARTVREYGKEWRFRLVESRLVALLVSGVVSLAGAGAGRLAGSAASAGEHGAEATGGDISTAEHIAEQVHHFLENPTTEQAIGALVGMGLIAGAKILKRRSVKKKIETSVAKITHESGRHRA